MPNGEQINFKNDKQIKDALEQWKAAELVVAAQNLKDAQSLRAVVGALEKSKAAELLKNKDNPEQWLELHRAHRALDAKIDEFGEKEPVRSAEQVLFDTILSLVVRGVMHEQLDLNPEEDGLDVSEILDNMENSPSDFFEREMERDEDFQSALELADTRDIAKVHARLAQILTRCNNAYTLKRADYKVETVKMQTMGFLGKSLFPALGGAVKKVQSKTPCGKGRGDWVDTPTCFILARTNDLLQEAKGRLSMVLEEREDKDAARQRRRRVWQKIINVFKK